MKRIERTEYLNKLIAFKDKSLIKVSRQYRQHPISTKRIADIMTTDGRKIGQKTVERSYTWWRPYCRLQRYQENQCHKMADGRNRVEPKEGLEVTSMRSLLRSVGCFQPDILSISHTSQIVTPRITENLISQPRIFEKYPVDCFNPELSRICSRILHCPIPTVV